MFLEPPSTESLTMETSKSSWTSLFYLAESDAAAFPLPCLRSLYSPAVQTVWLSELCPTATCEHATSCLKT